MTASPRPESPAPGRRSQESLHSTDEHGTRKRTRESDAEAPPAAENKEDAISEGPVASQAKRNRLHSRTSPEPEEAPVAQDASQPKSSSEKPSERVPEASDKEVKTSEPASESPAEPKPTPKPSPFAAISSSASPFARTAPSGNAFSSSSDPAGSKSPSAFGKAPSAFGSFSSASSPFGKAASASSSSSTAAGTPLAKAGASKDATASPFAKLAAAPSALNRPASASGDSTPSSAVDTKEKSPSADPSKPAPDEDPAASKARSAQAFGTMLKQSGATPSFTAVPDRAQSYKPLDEVITGEESEQTLFSARSKLFTMEGDAYRETGTGAMRVNKSLSSPKTFYRFVMRAEATHRLLLNAPLFPKMAFGIVEGKYVRFSLVLEGTLKTYLLKCGNADTAKTLSEVLTDAVAQLEESDSGNASEQPPTPATDTPEVKNADQAVAAAPSKEEV